MSSKQQSLYTRIKSRFEQVLDTVKTCKPLMASEEMEFLPASLEVAETPPSPIGRAIIWCIAAFVILAILWASFGKIDVVAVAEGKLIPSSQVKTIQPFESGVVAKILVRNGQIVQKGDLLIELDTVSSGADMERFDVELNAARLEKARLDALLAWTLALGGRPRLKIPKGADVYKVEQEQVYLAQAAETLLSKLKIYDNEIMRAEAQKQGTKHTTDKLKSILSIITKQTTVHKQLYDQGAVSENEWLQIETDRIKVKQDMLSSQQECQEAEASILLATEKRVQTVSEYRRDLLERKTKVITQIESLVQAFRKASQVNKQHRIIAPVSGKVQQLSVHTVGGVVSTAQPLMIIVPENNILEVEANILNKDIGFVREGQQVEIKLDAFPFTKHGIIDGTLRYVSNDAIQTDNRDLFYSALVDIDQSYIMVNGKEVNLISGMRATVEIKIRKRRVIEFFLSPLMQYTSESMKER